MANLTEGFNLTPIDVNRLPSISKICQGQIPGVIARGLQQCITDAVDPAARPEVPRKMELLLYLLPDADRKSALWSQPPKKPLRVVLAAGMTADSGRVQIMRSVGKLEVGCKTEETEPIAADDHSSILLAVEIHDLINGELDIAFKMASIRLYLDVNDSRKLAAFERKLMISIWVTSDEDRRSVELELRPLKLTEAPLIDKDRNTQRLYIHHGLAQVDDESDLPGDPDVFLDSRPGKQSAIGGADKFQP